MNTSIKEESVTKCLKHGKKILQIVLDANCLPDDRMFCSKCIELPRQPFNRVIGVAQAKEMIKEKILLLNAQIGEKSQPYLTKLTSLQEKLVAFRESQIKIMDNMIELIQQWLSEINNNMNTNQYIELAKGIELLQQDQQQFNIQLAQNGEAYLTKLNCSFDKLLKMEGIQECKQELINLPLNNEQKIQNEQVDAKNNIQLNKQIQTQQQVVKKKKGIINYKQINQVKQEQDCNAIAFNESGNIMIAGFNGNIKVWEFDNGKINQLTELKGQSSQINCLIYSKSIEWFASGDFDGNLQMWKQGNSNKEWLSSNIQSKQGCICCIILNYQENQLISCYRDIVVWQVNVEKNQLSYSQTLENKHTSEIHLDKKINEYSQIMEFNPKDQKLHLIKLIMNKWLKNTNLKGLRSLIFEIYNQIIKLIVNQQKLSIYFTNSFILDILVNFNLKFYHFYKNNYTKFQINYQNNPKQFIHQSLSLNDSETALVSCSRDKKIILWIKGAAGKWMYQNNVKMDYYLLRICFVNENEFIVQLYGKQYSNVFRIVNKQLQELKHLQIKLTDKDGDDNCGLFPTIYNKKNDVIIQKSSNYVYIITRGANGQFKVQAQPINCETHNNYGSMTEDGQHLVIYNEETKEFRIYKVNYE